MDKIIKWQGNARCDLCGEQVFDKIYDARVQTFQGITWANTCSACYTAYGVGTAEPFVWDKGYNAFIKVKHVSDNAQFLMDNLGITDDEAMNMLEDFGL